MQSGPSCEDAEIAYVTAYLAKRRSPLASFAGEIVELSDKNGLDDRFIVALAGAETTYGTSKTWDSATAGIYNVFDNGAHCAGTKPNYFCKTVNPYSGYGQSIAGVIQLLGSGRAFQPYTSTRDIFSIYERGDITKTSPGQDLLDTIYGSPQLQGNLSNVRKPRCP